MLDAQPILAVRPVDLAMTVVSTSAARCAAARAAFRRAFGVDLPSGPSVARSDGVSVIALGPERWSIVAAGDEPALERRVRAALGGSALVVAHGDARVVRRLSGAGVRHFLERIVAIDAHARALPPGTGVVTEALGISAWIWCDDDETVTLALPRSYAVAFDRLLAQAIAGFQAAVALHGVA